MRYQEILEACWKGYRQAGMKDKGGRQVPNCVPVGEQQMEEDLKKWFKEKWVRFGPDGKIRGDCARGSSSEGKPKCLPQSKAHALGKKGRASAAAKKRREDPDPERRGAAKNVATRVKEDESLDNPWHVTDVDQVTETDFEVTLKDLNDQQLNYIVRPVDFIEEQPNRFRIDSMDVRDLQTGQTMHWHTGNAWRDNTGKIKPWVWIFGAIDYYFWHKPPLQKQLRNIIDYYLEAGEQGKNPDLMPGLKDRPFHSIGSDNAIPADRFIKAHQDMKKVTGQLDEKQDACYNKVKSRYKVWPSAYASGALVQCRKKGAANWGTGAKKK